MKNIRKSMMLVLISTLAIQVVYSQQVEVQGELKVTEMTANDIEDNLVIRNTDGTLGTRSVNSLPPPPAPIDTTRNLASDFELAKQLCDCPNLPPFMIQRLLESGYTEADLLGAGISLDDIYNSDKYSTLLDDRDNQTYTTIRIGTQTWMAENLNIGTMINSTTGGDDNDGEQNDNSIIEKYCYANAVANCTTYGGLYQWKEVMQHAPLSEPHQGVCPTGWHLPTDTEWMTLEMQLGMSSSEANLIGYRGTDQGSQLAGYEPLWTNDLLDQNGAFGSSGFAGLPAGASFSGTTLQQFMSAYFWSSSESGGFAQIRHLSDSSSKVEREAYVKSLGLSVRCVQN